MRGRLRFGIVSVTLSAACHAGGTQCAPFMFLPAEFLEPCTTDDDCGQDLQCLSRTSAPGEPFCSIACENSADCHVAFNDTSGCMMCFEEVCGGSGCD